MKEKRDTYVFISYASADRRHALDLYQSLSGKWHRITCWMDVYDIAVDDATFQEHILRGIQNASALVLVESDASRQSVYVQRELAEARTSGIPVFRHRVAISQDQSEPAEKPRGINALLRRLQLAWLDLRIKFRITQPFWLANLAILLVIAGMGTAIYFLGRTVTPLVVEALDRSLPEPLVVDQLQQETPVPLDPAAEAPFHFKPGAALLSDDFSNDGGINEAVFRYDIKPGYEQVSIRQQDGILNFDLPPECTREDLYWSCETEINTHRLTLPALQYFGLRLRAPQGLNPLREVSFSISVTGPYRRRTGFGWAFSNHVTPFFRPNVLLPEPEYYAYIPLDDRWHAYEIVVDPDTGTLFYYMDGQLIDKIAMRHFTQWQDAPLVLIIYTMGEIIKQQETPFDIAAMPATHLEIDQIMVGSFTD